MWIDIDDRNFWVVFNSFQRTTSKFLAIKANFSGLNFKLFYITNLKTIPLGKTHSVFRGKRIIINTHKNGGWVSLLSVDMLEAWTEGYLEQKNRSVNSESFWNCYLQSTIILFASWYSPSSGSMQPFPQLLQFIVFGISLRTRAGMKQNQGCSQHSPWFSVSNPSTINSLHKNHKIFNYTNQFLLLGVGSLDRKGGREN